MNLSDCPKCYEMKASECNNILISAALAPNTEYQYTLEDKFGNMKIRKVTTDEDGDFLIDVTLFPDGYFTRWSGVFTVTVQTKFTKAYYNYDCNDAMLIICGTMYSCIQISFYKSL